MNKKDLFLIANIHRFAPQIGHLVSMLQYTRYTTLSEIEGLHVEQLDSLFDGQSNSIGALLAHVAAVEVWFQAETFFGRELDAREMQEWGAALDLGETARREIRGRELTYYLNRLKQVRLRTLLELKQQEDKWLEEQTVWGGRQANNYFKWFHVIEDEISHRGQIRWLRRHALNSKS